MGIFNKIFGKNEEHKETQIITYKDFWDWFVTQEKDFYETIKNHQNIETDFFDVIAPKLKEINAGFYFLAGMSDDSVAELILTVEGDIKNIVFAEEIIEIAPKLNHWKFTALKPEMNLTSGIEMDGKKFSSENIFFYENLNEETKDAAITGVCVFLDNFLGELNFATQIDTFNVIGKDNAKKELVPITKLKDFLSWREREFTEKYKNVKNFDEEDQFSVFEATLKNGVPLIAAINTSLLTYDSKASYPWISILKVQYNGENNNGLPEKEDYEKLSNIEEQIIEELKIEDGNLYIGRENADNLKESYFASKDFRKPSKVLKKVIDDHPEYKMTLEIYKDKYWQSFERYNVNQN